MAEPDDGEAWCDATVIPYVHIYGQEIVFQVIAAVLQPHCSELLRVLANMNIIVTMLTRGCYKGAAIILTRAESYVTVSEAAFSPTKRALSETKTGRERESPSSRY
ncbi:MAG: hypothetical protein HW416_42 [Chloroflexi bacterium]|nr:hypothetical protein [Chloroflexota bacterium]